MGPGQGNDTSARGSFTTDGLDDYLSRDRRVPDKSSAMEGVRDISEMETVLAMDCQIPILSP